MYCDGCIYLDVTEYVQNILKSQNLPHICLKYNEQVKHLGHHPHIYRLDICIKENGYESE